MKSHQEKTELEKRLEAEAHAEQERAAAEKGNGKDRAGDEAQAAPEPAAVDVDALIRERDELQDRVLRMRAEFDNFRKRMARESDRIKQQAAEALIRDLLPVADHLELALRHKEGGADALGEGVEMVLRQFHEVLGRHGLEPIEAVGQPFNPEVHEAVTQRESTDVPPDSVIEEFQKGYRLGQMVLRPSKVVVSMGSADLQQSGASPEDDESTGIEQ